MSETQARAPSALQLIREEAARMEPEWAAALPAQIPVERFKRVVLTAISSNSDLANPEKCSRRSLWRECMKAAQDGLLLDGREAALVVYKGEAQYVPMIAGIRKKVRNSGEIATWDVHAVYENDAFEFELGDDPFIRHKPSLSNRGKLIAVYSVATLKHGEKSRDVMSVEEVEKIRALSRAKNGPWANPTFYPEMAKKTVARRHAKMLPMSSDLDDLIRRDDRLYDLEAAADDKVKPRASLGDKLAAIASLSASSVPDSNADEEIDRETGEIIEGEAVEMEAEIDETDPPQEVAMAKADPEKLAAAANAGDAGTAYERGRDARRKGMARRAVPPEYRDESKAELAKAWIAGWEDEAQTVSA